MDPDEKNTNDSGTDRQTPSGETPTGRGEDIDPAAVDLDPVQAVEKELSSRLQAEDEEAQSQLDVTAGVHEILVYLETLVNENTDLDIGPGEKESKARKDLALLIGDIVHRHEWAWLASYGKELYAIGLAMTLYGGPIGAALAKKLWTAYLEAVGGSNGT